MHVNDIIKKSAKKAPGTFTHGVTTFNSERLPTGVFPFDLATGGGIPKGRATILFGPESSLKTTLALLAIAELQRSDPSKHCAFLDIENALDPAWARKLGVDTDKLLYATPEFAEQGIDLVEDLLLAEDVGIVVLDSIAALTSAFELTQSAEDQPVGRSGLNGSKLARRVSVALSRSRREGRFPALVLINQIRYKIGVTHGDPETMPGGKGPVFLSALTVRLYGKDLNEAKMNSSMPWAKEVSGIVRKFKVPINARTFKFRMPNMDIPHMNVRVGKPSSFKTVKAYMQKLGHLEKVKEGYRVFEDTYPTLTAWRETMESDHEYRQAVESHLISELLEQDGGLSEGDSDED